MKYNELERFTHEELSKLTYSQLSLDKLVLLEKITNGEINIPDDISQKLYEACNESIKKYVNVTGDNVSFVLPRVKSMMTLKDKITCFSIIYGILDKAISNESLRDLFNEISKKLSDFVSTRFQ